MQIYSVLTTASDTLHIYAQTQMDSNYILEHNPPTPIQLSIQMSWVGHLASDQNHCLEYSSLKHKIRSVSMVIPLCDRPHLYLNTTTASEVTILISHVFSP